MRCRHRYSSTYNIMLGGGAPCWQAVVRVRRERCSEREDGSDLSRSLCSRSKRRKTSSTSD
jgi:hypothetical protein